MRSKSALVTGGAGFVGSHLSESLIADGYEVFCVDNSRSGRRENISSLLEKPRFILIDADVREKLGFPAVDEVYHLASRASPKDFTSHPVRIALRNTEGTRNLLDYAVENDATFLYASTSEVYGNPEVHPQTEEYNGNVNIRGPRGCYDKAKRFGETLTVVYEDRYDLDVRTVRIFNTYGPRMRPDDGRVVPTFLGQALADEDVTIHGEGEQTRSFCYVSDLVGGIRSVMDIPEMKGDAVNLGEAERDHDSRTRRVRPRRHGIRERPDPRRAAGRRPRTEVPGHRQARGAARVQPGGGLRRGPPADHRLLPMTGNAWQSGNGRRTRRLTFCVHGV
jgi:UDP-glucuronate decarboxylase